MSEHDSSGQWLYEKITDNRRLIGHIAEILIRKGIISGEEAYEMFTPDLPPQEEEDE